MSANAFHCAAQWKKGRDWLDQSEGIWTDLIGAQRWENQQVQVQVLTPQAQAQIEALEEQISEAMDNKGRGLARLRADIAHIRKNPNNYTVGWVNTQVYINESSDGLVHRTSQIGNIVNPTSLTYVKMVDNVNHIQQVDARSEPNDPMKRVFNEIWDKTEPGYIFNIDPR